MIKCKRCNKTFKTSVEVAQHSRWEHREEIAKEKAIAVASSPKLTTRTMVGLHPEKIALMAKIGTAEAFKQHPEWRDALLGRGEKQQYLYSAVNAYRNRVDSNRVKSFPGRPPGHKLNSDPEVAQLLTQICTDPKMKHASGKMREWGEIFAAYPQALKVFGLKDGNVTSGFRTRFYRFRNRLLQGQQEGAPASNGNGHHSFTQEEVDSMIAKAKAEVLSAINFCPKCGHNLLMHTKAYNVALRHSGE